MTISLDDYNRLRKRVEELKAVEDRAEGALAQLKKRGKELGLTDLIGAEKLLKELEKQERAELREAEEATAKFDEKWKEKLQ